MNRLDIIKSKGYLTELVANAKYNKLSNEKQAEQIHKVVNEAIELVKANSVLGDVSKCDCIVHTRAVKTSKGIICYDCVKPK